MGVTEADLDPSAAGIRALRPPRGRVDPWRVHAALEEIERTPEGGTETVVTLFLAGAECPFTCVFCDLWRWTTVAATPPGALPRQIELALEELGEAGRAAQALKLYNASNFFDPRAVPDEDVDAVVRSTASFDRLTVESHPRLLGRRAEALANSFPGRLEVAMGLETVHPTVLPRLGKQMSVSDFDRAADWLAARDIDLRTFVLLGLPFLEPEEQTTWAVRSVEHAIAAGAGRVAIIPVRDGNGTMEVLADRGRWRPPDLGLLEETFAACSGVAGAVVTVDTWDLDRLAACPACAPHRLERLRRANLAGVLPPSDPCPACGWPGGARSCRTTR